MQDHGLWGRSIPAVSADSESCITFHRLTLPVSILSTCCIIKEEAKPIIERILARLKLESIRYIVASPVSRCFASYGSPLYGIFAPEGNTTGSFRLGQHSSAPLKRLVARCATFFDTTRPVHPDTLRQIEITIDHKPGFVEGSEIRDALKLFPILSYELSVQLNVTYKTLTPSPPPIAGLSQLSTSSLQLFLQQRQASAAMHGYPFSCCESTRAWTD